MLGFKTGDQLSGISDHGLGGFAQTSVVCPPSPSYFQTSKRWFELYIETVDRQLELAVSRHAMLKTFEVWRSYPQYPASIQFTPLPTKQGEHVQKCFTYGLHHSACEQSLGMNPTKTSATELKMSRAPICKKTDQSSAQWRWPEASESYCFWWHDALVNLLGNRYFTPALDALHLDAFWVNCLEMQGHHLIQGWIPLFAFLLFISLSVHKESARYPTKHLASKLWAHLRFLLCFTNAGMEPCNLAHSYCRVVSNLHFFLKNLSWIQVSVQ